MKPMARHKIAIYSGVVGFVLTLLLADWLITRYALSGPLLILVAVLPIVPLSYWWRQYPREIAQLDELERSIEFKALAWGTGLGLWVVTVWAILQAYNVLPEMPLFLVAPIVAVFYGLARWQVARKYR